ncbi:TVP38/TMEM64 family protein [Methylomonas sp. MgM2]
MKLLKKNYFTILTIILFLLISLYLYEHVTLETIKSNKTLLSGFVEAHYTLSVFLFFIFCTIFVNSPVPFAAILKVLGGFFFGLYLGAIYNIIATIVACLVGFGISRYAFKESFEKKYYKRIKKVETKIEKNGFYYFLTLRLVMVVPYFLINITAGISRVSFKDFLFSTMLGVVPASLIYANGGNKLEHINSLSELFTSDVILAMLLIASITLLPTYTLKQEPF